MPDSCFEAFRPQFTSKNLGQPRLVWDPMVHKHVGEDCWIILVRFADRPRGLIRSLEEELHDLGFRGPCVYLLFGYYDALLRVWGTKSRVEELKKRLKGLVGEQGVAEPHQIQKVYYDDWSTHKADVDEGYLDRYEEHIRNLTSVSLAPDPFLAKIAIRELVGAHLIHVLDPLKAGFTTETPIVKSYIALIKTAERDPDKQLAAVRRVLEEIPKLFLKSVYWAEHDHFAFFVKVVVAVDDFFELDCSLQALESALAERDLGLRIMTLVIANRDAAEADLVATDAPVISGTAWDTLARQLSLTAQRSLAGGSQAFLDRLQSLYASGKKDSLYKPFEKHFNFILEACALRDDTKLLQAVTVVAALEGGLRSWLQSEMLPAVFGANWGQSVRELVSEKPVRFTFGPMVIMLGKIANIDQSFAAEIDETLGDGWLDRLGEARDARNFMLHRYVTVPGPARPTPRPSPSGGSR